MKHYNCIFTGGSVIGFCYVGVLKAFEELNIKIDIHAGSSIGAIILTFYSLGYSLTEIKEEIDKLKLYKLLLDFNPNFICDCGISKGSIYYNWLKKKIEIKFYGKYSKDNKPVCFKDIETDLIIVSTNLNTSKSDVFSKETTPDMEIALALRLSSSMPFVFKPLKYNGNTYIDGDILRGRPIWKVADKLIEEPEKLLEFRITGGNRNKIYKNPINFANSIINATAYNIDNNAVNTYKDFINIVQIDVNNTLYTDFNLSDKRKQEIYKIGYDTTMKYFFDKINRKEVNNVL